MKKFKVIAFTHKFLELSDIGKLHMGDDELANRLRHLKEKIGVDELMYLSTCNRVEFTIVSNFSLSNSFLKRFFEAFQPNWEKEEVKWAMDNARVYEGYDALKHIFYVASSIDSLVVGEREIITQVRQYFEKCKEANVTGDFVNLLVRRTIETAKKVYTETQIAQKPVSVVSLAYRKLQELNINSGRVLIIGAGQTISAMSRFLQKHKGFDFTIFNRSVENAENLKSLLNADVQPLNNLSKFEKGFDIMITCTGASEPIITDDIYNKLSKDGKQKVIIDLALPSDIEQSIVTEKKLTYIGLEDLKSVARRNLEERQKELEACKVIVENNIQEFRLALRERQIELAMKDVPEMIKEIKDRALNSVFEKEVSELDENSKKVLNEVINYFEKKYISVPMKMAKNIMKKD